MLGKPKQAVGTVRQDPYQTGNIHRRTFVGLRLLVPSSHCEEFINRVKVMLGISWWCGLAIV